MGVVEVDGNIVVFGGVDKFNNMYRQAYQLIFDDKNHTYEAKLLLSQLSEPDRFQTNQVVVDNSNPSQMSIMGRVCEHVIKLDKKHTVTFSSNGAGYLRINE